MLRIGAVIVGTVQGGRIWGKELKGLALTHVQWSPDSKVILFGHNKGEVQIYDSHGTYNVSKLGYLVSLFHLLHLSVTVQAGDPVSV